METFDSLIYSKCKWLGDFIPFKEKIITIKTLMNSQLFIK